MATKLQRYEAVVKLSTGEVVPYHNINTGLFKFHKFVCEKFNSGQIWIYYTVRRIETLEIIGTFVRETEEKKINAVKIFVNNESNLSGSGFIFHLPFVRNGYTLSRNLFIANSQVLERNNNFICFSEHIYLKMIKEAKKALYEFYLNKGHQIMPDEFEVGGVEMVKVLVTKKGKAGVYPTINFP